jgi:hypothetical protein
MLLKKKIQSKFGSISNFSLASGIPYFSVINAMRKGDEVLINALDHACDTVEPRPAANTITDQERKEVRLAILTNYKNYSDFADVTGISLSVISRMISGHIKRHTKHTRTIMSILKLWT